VIAIALRGGGGVCAWKPAPQILRGGSVGTTEHAAKAYDAKELCGESLNMNSMVTNGRPGQVPRAKLDAIHAGGAAPPPLRVENPGMAI